MLCVLQDAYYFVALHCALFIGVIGSDLLSGVGETVQPVYDTLRVDARVCVDEQWCVGLMA